MADNSVEYALVRVSSEEMDRLYRDAEKAGAQGVCGVPVFCTFDGIDLRTYPQAPPGAGRLDIRGDRVFYVPEPAKRPISEFREYFNKMWDGVQAAQRKEHPAQIPEPDDIDFSDDFPCGICGQRGLHACVPPPAPTIFNRIVSMVEFKGRLYVATERGVFVKVEDADTFVELEFVSAKEWNGGGRAADEAAGLVPLHPRQTAERADPFVPNKFGEH